MMASTVTVPQSGGMLAMSAASIDRYLKPVKATDRIRGVRATRPPALLRSSIKVPYPTSAKASESMPAEAARFRGHSQLRHGSGFAGNVT